MFIRWIFAAAHLLTFGLGLVAILSRSRALRETTRPTDLKKVFAADNLWGLAALLWLGTGLARVFGEMEKGSAYYGANWVFWLKMVLFGLIFVLEIWPMTTLIRWRIQTARRQEPNLAPAQTFANIGRIQAVLLVLIVLAATAMARGYGM